jgi:hypothetical protein
VKKGEEPGWKVVSVSSFLLVNRTAVHNLSIIIREAGQRQARVAACNGTAVSVFGREPGKRAVVSCRRETDDRFIEDRAVSGNIIRLPG